jgi:hypothetical protein
MAAATCYGEAVCGGQAGCGDCREALGGGTVYFIGSNPPIPVRRYGIVPPPSEPEWEIEPADADGPRTIAEYGGTVVLLAGLLAAVVVGGLLFLR